MSLSEEELSRLKKHCKVDISYDDDLIEEYYTWAYEDIVSSVTHENDYDKSFFDNHKLFKMALYPLVAYYYENRVAYQERNLSYAPNMVLSVVHKLRAEYGSDEDA